MSDDWRHDYQSATANTQSLDSSFSTPSHREYIRHFKSQVDEARDLFETCQGLNSAFFPLRVSVLQMFHKGDLQSGIAQALADSKLIACFVSGGFRIIHSFRRASTNLYLLDDAEQSILWEDEFLQDQEVIVSSYGNLISRVVLMISDES